MVYVPLSVVFRAISLFYQYKRHGTTIARAAKTYWVTDQQYFTFICFFSIHNKTSVEVFTSFLQVIFSHSVIEFVCHVFVHLSHNYDTKRPASAHMFAWIWIRASGNKQLQIGQRTSLEPRSKAVFSGEYISGIFTSGIFTSGMFSSGIFTSGTSTSGICISSISLSHVGLVNTIVSRVVVPTQIDAWNSMFCSGKNFSQSGHSCRELRWKSGGVAGGKRGEAEDLGSGLGISMDEQLL